MTQPTNRNPEYYYKNLVGIFCGMITTLCVFMHGLVQAQTTKSYPVKPVTILVGSAAGGSNDTFARALSKPLQELLGQSFIVENKPAAGGILANNILAKSAPDGYTIAVVSSTFTTGAAIRDNLTYDALESFTPVAILAKGPLLITVSKQTPFNTIAELVDYARLHPGKLNYGTSGVGSINQFATELFADAANISLTHVPYKGMNPAITDLIGGQIDILVASAPSLLSQVNGQKIRALSVTTTNRSDVIAQLPSASELGYAQSAVDLWWGVLAPAGVAPDIVEKLNHAINQALSSQAMREFLLKEGASAAPGTSAAFKMHIQEEIERWKRVAEIANIQAD
jgi:hypothetical protein